MHFRNWGRTLYHQLQQHGSSGLVHDSSKEHFDNFIVHFLSALPPGRRFSKPPTDGNAKRYTKRFSLEAQNN